MRSVAKNIISVQCYSLRKTAVEKENKDSLLGTKWRKFAASESWVQRQHTLNFKLQDSRYRAKIKETQSKENSMHRLSETLPPVLVDRD